MPSRDESRNHPRVSNTSASAQVEIDDPAVLTALAGPRNENLKMLETETGGRHRHARQTIFTCRGRPKTWAFVERGDRRTRAVGIREGTQLTQPAVARAVRISSRTPRT